MSKLMVVGATLVGLGILLLAVVFSGVYDVGADRPHAFPVYALLEALRERSIERRAAGIAVPALDDPARVHEGAEHYSAMCVDRHLAPGITVSEIRAGLSPRPPNLAQRAVDPQVAFWAIKHGIQATGMPAWGQTHNDQEIWNIVSFVHQLPHMSPDEYRAMTAVVGTEEHASGADEHHEHAQAHD